MSAFVEINPLSTGRYLIRVSLGAKNIIIKGVR